MFATAGITALAMFWVVLPVIDMMTGRENVAERKGFDVVSDGGTPKGDFVLLQRTPKAERTRKAEFKRQTIVETTLHPQVSPKGNFLGWFPETGNLELEFQITQTEDPLAFERPRFSFPNVAEQTTTRLVAFANAPFPVAATTAGFLSKKPAHRTGTFSDPRALIHIPKGFDIDAPGVMVVFYHGHGATLRRDVYKRQRVPQQITESGVNAVVVAPQFAVNARSSNPGKLSRKGGLRRFLDEVAIQLADEHGAPGAREVFAKMPVIVVAYSGGYEPAAWSVSRGGLGKRLKGLVLLDALYGHTDRFANWIASDRSAFLINAYAGGSPRRNSQKLKAILRDKGVSYKTELNGQLRPGSVTFLSAVTSHRSYVTRAWTPSPIADVLRRMRYVLGDPPLHLRTIAASQ